MKRTIFRGLYLRVDLSKIDFSAPVRSHYCTNPQDLAWARKQIHAYIKEGVLAPSLSQDHLVHPWFVIRKKGKRRLVIDFDRLNQAILHSPSVSYEDLSQAPSLIRRRPWMVSIDLKSAFHHIPLSPSLIRLSCIRLDHQVFAFQVLSFGLNMAPKIFCSILQAALDHLRLDPIRPLKLIFYMDDILLASPTRRFARADALLLISHLLSLGFVINFDKSVIYPTRLIQHLGLLINTYDYSFRIPPHKLSDLTSFCQTVAIRPQIRLLTARSLLGKLLALRLAFSPVRRFTWNLIQEISIAIPPTRLLRSQQRHLRISLSTLARSDLFWIANNLASFPPSRFLSRPSVHVFTDASNTGWGAWVPRLNLGVHGKWTITQLPPIHCLELAAVIHACSALPLPPHSRIALHTDNTAIIAYLRRWGGSGSPQLQSLVHNLWDILLAKSLSIHTVTYISTTDNWQADRLSRL
ncbi:MAG: reverse transcriptase domain-containing protein [Candidatus Paceibacterota bacterium]